MLSDYKEKLEKGEGLGLDWIMSRSEGNSTIKYPNPCSGGGKNKMELGTSLVIHSKVSFCNNNMVYLKTLFISITSNRANFSFSLCSLFSSFSGRESPKFIKVHAYLQTTFSNLSDVDFDDVSKF